MSTFRFLHVSDLHFCKQPNRHDALQLFDTQKRKAATVSWFRENQPLFWPSSYDPDLAEATARVAYEKRDELDGILITGDLATTGLEEDLQHAYRFVDDDPHDVWLGKSRSPTLKASGLSVILLPGNHDRYADNYGTPGSQVFDDVFATYWPRNHIVADSVIGKSGEYLAFVSADFALSSVADVSPIHPIAIGTIPEKLDSFLCKYGQGRAYPHRIGALIERTSNLQNWAKNEGKPLCVIWAIHFPPCYQASLAHLALNNGQAVLDAAVNNNVQLILTGHVHEALEYQPEKSVTVFSAGTACSVSCRENQLHIIDIEAFNGQLSFRRTDLTWDQGRQNFV